MILYLKQFANIYDVKNKTIPAVRNSKPIRRYKTGEKVE